MTSSEQTDKLIPALVAALAEMPHPAKDGTNPHFGSRFATLPGVLSTVRPVLARHGLALLQAPGTGTRGPVVHSTLMHASGQWLELPPLEMPAVKSDPQSWGSCLSYTRRYAVLALCGVAGEDDDDGHAASQPAPARKAVGSIVTVKPAAPAKAAKAKELPADGKELAERLKAFEAKLRADGYFREPGGLMAPLMADAEAEGFPEDVAAWTGEAITWAVEHARGLAERRGWKAGAKQKVG